MAVQQVVVTGVVQCKGKAVKDAVVVIVPYLGARRGLLSSLKLINAGTPNMWQGVGTDGTQYGEKPENKDLPRVIGFRGKTDANGLFALQLDINTNTDISGVQIRVGCDGGKTPASVELSVAGIKTGLSKKDQITFIVDALRDARGLQKGSALKVKSKEDVQKLLESFLVSRLASKYTFVAPPFQCCDPGRTTDKGLKGTAGDAFKDIKLALASVGGKRPGRLSLPVGELAALFESMKPAAGAAAARPAAGATTGALMKELRAAGLRDVTALASMDPAAVELPGLDATARRDLRDMAALVREVPDLGPQEAEVLVRGLGLRTAAALRRAAPTLTRAKVDTALNRLGISSGLAAELLTRRVRSLGPS